MKQSCRSTILRRRSILAAAAATTLLLSSCGTTGDNDADGQTAGGGANAEPDTVVWGQLTGVSPIFVGIDNGYFEEVGIDVELQFVASGSDLMPLIASNQIDAGASSPAGGFFNALSRGIGIKIVADSGQYLPGYGFGGLVARQDLVESGEVTEVADLKGRTIGITASGSAMQLLAIQAVEQAGLTQDDVELVTMDFPAMVASLESGEIDAGMLSEPFLNQAQKREVGSLLVGADEINPGGQQIVMVYSPGLMEDEDLATRFMEAWIRSVRDYNAAYEAGGDAQAEVDASQAEHLGLDPTVLDGSVPYGLDPDGALNEEDLEARLNAWVDLGIVEEPIPVNEFVDDTIREAALERIGEE